MGLLPTSILLFERRLQRVDKRPVAVHLISLIHCGRIPGAEFIHLLHRLAVVAMIPGVENLVDVCCVAQPSGLHHVVADGTGNEVVAVGIGTLHEKLRHAVTHWGALDMFAQSPPTVVIHLTEIILRTVEERHVLAHPFRRLAVGDSVGDVLVLHRIEVVDVVFVVVELQHSSLPVSISSVGLHICDRECSHGIRLVGTRHVEILVCRSLVVWLCKERTGAEHHPCYCLHRSVELALTHFLVVDIICAGMHVGRKNSLHTIGFSCLIVLEHGTETRTTLHLHHSERVEHYTGASLTFGVDKLHIKLSMTVLCCLDIKLYGKLLCGRYHTFHLGIVVRVFV